MRIWEYLSAITDLGPGLDFVYAGSEYTIQFWRYWSDSHYGSVYLFKSGNAINWAHYCLSKSNQEIELQNVFFPVENDDEIKLEKILVSINQKDYAGIVRSLQPLLNWEGWDAIRRI